MSKSIHDSTRGGKPLGADKLSFTSQFPKQCLRRSNIENNDRKRIQCNRGMVEYGISPSRFSNGGIAGGSTGNAN
jgi:hypothetical protein